MIRFRISRCAIWMLALWAMLSSSMCFAIDNPEMPDLVAGFEARSKKFEINVREHAQSTGEVIRAYAEYEEFLNKELNQAYQGLIKRLDGDAKQKLIQSQRHWLEYRDFEFSFIAKNWTVERFGSSAAFSRGAYRTTVIRDRVVELLNYLKNYGPVSN